MNNSFAENDQSIKSLFFFSLKTDKCLHCNSELSETTNISLTIDAQNNNGTKLDLNSLMEKKQKELRIPCNHKTDFIGGKYFILEVKNCNEEFFINLIITTQNNWFPFDCKNNKPYYFHCAFIHEKLTDKSNTYFMVMLGEFFKCFRNNNFTPGVSAISFDLIKKYFEKNKITNLNVIYSSNNKGINSLNKDSLEVNK